MPSALLDNDEKYKNLIESYTKIQNEIAFTTKNDESNEKNQLICESKIANIKKSECRVFDNIFDSLVWLTEQNDKNLFKNYKKSNNNNNNIVNNFATEADKKNDKKSKINVLITGSLYLVGLSLQVLNAKID